MISTRKSVFIFVVVSGYVFASSVDAGAFDMNGAWAASIDQCGKIFVRKGRASTIGFTTRANRYGGGFIVEGAQIRDNAAKCKIKTRNEDGQTQNLVVGCAADILLSNVQLILRPLDENTMVRQFSGIEGMELKYHRCSI